MAQEAAAVARRKEIYDHLRVAGAATLNFTKVTAEATGRFDRIPNPAII
ncbi:MAG: hypothetical protein ACLPKT_02385 [Methylocella sp.]